MYSNKENVNTLTVLLAAHGVHHAVVCPGSRNAPIVHNLNECPDIACHPVTDERSAGFYALGMAQCVDEPVAVCVTSGTALLNLLPAVAEAYYQHVPLVVISADRPQAWIDQLDGQTLPQSDALGRFVARAVSLPEPRNDEEHWHCNRLVNEALIAARRGVPVHINVPITEPLFQFTVGRLPAERCISYLHAACDFNPAVCQTLLTDFAKARRPMVVVGQIAAADSGLAAALEQIAPVAVVLNESLSHPEGGVCFDEVLCRIQDDPRYVPDFVLYCGGTLVSKRLRKFLRTPIEAVWRVSEQGDMSDTFMNLTGVVAARPADVIAHIAGSAGDRASDYIRLWWEAFYVQEAHLTAYQPDYSLMMAVRRFEHALQARDGKVYVHYANSSAVRLANIYARHYVWCNRGVNGIEGSLSTAAGFSLVAGAPVFCVIGDLSFFYDQNALWNQQLRGNLRILLLNNGGGGIFRQLQGLEQSPARDRLVAASHATTAEGICRQNGVGYLSAHDASELAQGLEQLLNNASDRPLLLEVFTDPAEDARVLKAYYGLA